MFRKALAWIETNAFLMGALLCFTLTILLAILDHVAAGTLIGALFVVLVLFHFLPQMESFKAYGVEAKWRARLGEAEEILKKLRAAATVSARLTYHTLGWGSRLANPVKIKQQLADQVDALLLELGTDDDMMEKIKAPYLLFSMYDLYGVFRFVADQNAHANIERCHARMNELANADNDEVRALRERVKDLEQQPAHPGFEGFRAGGFKGQCTALIRKGSISDADAEVLGKFAEQLSEMAERCLASGRVTDEAAEVIESHTYAKRVESYRALFG